MPCSKCKKDGHNRATCKELEVVAAPVQPVPKIKKVEEVIEIPAEDRIKLGKLAALCSEVACTLGKGYTENVYQYALCIELQAHGIRYGHEIPMPIIYKGQAIPHSTQRLDIVLYDYLPFIFELKATNGSIKSCERWQLVRYMEQQGKQYGAVVNYAQTSNGPFELSFIIKHNGVYKLYDVVSGSVQVLADYGYAGDGDDDAKE